MSTALRVIPCLDVAAGRVVKGVNFENLRDAGDPVELAGRYAREGADEITFLDVTASAEARSTTLEAVSRTAEQVFIPLTVGGGVRSTEDVARLLGAGADKVGVSTAACERPELLSEISADHGSQVTVLSVDARRCRDGEDTPSGFTVTTHGGRTATGRDLVQWLAEACDRGIGEVLLNSMDADGTTAGFDTEMIEAARSHVTVPLIASGGAGTPEHFVEAARSGADAVLAASVFHFGHLTIAAVKAALADAGFEVRR